MADSSVPGSSSRHDGGSTKTPVPKLNPDAKDYVPRGAAAAEGASVSSSQPGGSSSNPRNRRRRNPDVGKGGSGDQAGKKPSEHNRDGENSNSNSNNNRQRRNRPRAPKQPVEGAARIDDYHEDDDIEINMDRPVEAPENSIVGPSLTTDSGSKSTAAGKDRRREGAGRRDKDGAASSSSSPKPQQGKGDKTRVRTGGADRPEEGFSSGRNASRRSNNNSNTDNSGNNSNVNAGANRRQRNKKTGDLGGRTFPTATAVPVAQAGESSGSRHGTQRNAQRSQPKKFVHTVEEDRDLMAALTDGLTNSKYDCMVCWDVIRPAHKVWNCQVCWAAFHLGCLSTWATKSSDDSNNNGSGWRCPGCQNTQVAIPKDYVCFCGKVNNPDFNRYLTPHSCGELCGRSRDCPHPCNILPSNPLVHVTLVHALPAEALAQSSPVIAETEEQTCYCGKHERQARCGDGEPKTTTAVGGVEHTGFYECHEICHRPLACGHHECTKSCHPLDEEPGQCSARPEAVTTCPCGSKTIEVILKGGSRTSCTDPIPVCGGVCKKALKCGHRCMQKCHLGECAPCKMSVMVDCRCGSTRVQRVCSDMGMYGNELPRCDRICRNLRACGKHECNNRCCPAKNRPKDKKLDPIALEAHICPLVCGKKLRCGVHTCEMLCHKGHCNPCLNASFDELSCACGRTVLYPPIPCGTPIPKCRYTCTRPRACGHTSFTNHPCHPDSEPCPPCIMLVSKQCMCRKNRMPNVPCYKSNPSCGKICGKGLDCGLHKCIKSCHAGECLNPPTDICTQACPRPRKSCGHKCGVSCHGDAPCPEDQPCQVTVPSSCKCGHLTMESACNASAENPWDGKPRIIKCNDYCLIAERNKRVALALDIEEAGDPGPRIPDYDEYVLDYAAANMEFTLKIEKQLAAWVADTTKPILHFPPMKHHRRKFIHELAAHYDVTSESMDVEPYRNVAVRRQLGTSVPGLLASQACRQKRPLRSSTSASAAVEQLRKPMIKDPVNAIYLHDLAFGLTRSELAAQLAPIFGNIKYGIRWLTDDDAVLVPQPGSMQMDELEAVLVRLRTGIKVVAAKGSLCERVELCWVNREGEVVSHTNISGGSQTKRFFNASQGNQWTKTAPAMIKNTFALLDDDERNAAAKRAEEERVLKAKEAAGTLSSEAWDEEASSSSSKFAVTAGGLTSGLYISSPPSVSNVSQLGQLQAAEDLTKFVVVEAGEFTDEVVDDWQELLEDDDETDSVKADGDSSEQGQSDKESTTGQKADGETNVAVSSKGSSDDEGVLVSEVDLPAEPTA
ncbi:FKBP12-associated protein [Dissophora globulifera]|uniref:FKBP12-associated protein n=1 Tax=Dissophora globulifera TaxID=979702 RepID=A0A9P6UU07_9FUNG|nr:FKBP12-associated protein [Dissophora globulifera]